MGAFVIVGTHRLENLLTPDVPNLENNFLIFELDLLFQERHADGGEVGLPEIPLAEVADQTRLAHACIAANYNFEFINDQDLHRFRILPTLGCPDSS